jgi:oligo-1,6-glucosidase
MPKISSVSRFLLFLVAMIAGCDQKKAAIQNSEKKWWKEAVIYQIYPRSFKDSDGDGIGDLKGIISKLDYIKSLGVDAIWLNPVYSSPNDDNGYDVSDYRNIQKEFGTMNDFDSLVKGLHERNIKLVMDLVFNHSSDEHEWFKQSRSSRTSPYRNYYHWWNAERGKPPYRYSLSDASHDAWKYDSQTNAYYLHYFSRKQPDLNWENPQLRKEVYDIMRFWADRGTDGFRLDAFQFAAKDTSFPEFPAGLDKNFQLYYAMGPHLHDYLKEMNQEVLSHYDMMSVAEGAGNTMEDAHDLVDPDRKELDMAYPFEGVDIAKRDGYSLLHFKEVFSRWDSAFAANGWLSVFLANHDQARLVSRFGNDSDSFREVSAKMLATFILSMRGTPYWYYGDELGMTNPGFTKISEYRDMAAFSEYKYQKEKGGDTVQFLKKLRFSGRDNGRTPFQWDSSANAGFTTGIPWIAVNPDYREVNAALEEKDPNSCLNYFRKMIRLRRNNPALVYGSYSLLDKNNPKVYAYLREWDGKKILVLLNFSGSNAPVDIGSDHSKNVVLLSNYQNSPVQKNGGAILELRPYEAGVFLLKDK